MPVRWRLVPTVIADQPGYDLEQEVPLFWFWSRWNYEATLSARESKAIEEHIKKGTIYLEEDNADQA